METDKARVLKLFFLSIYICMSNIYICLCEYIDISFNISLNKWGIFCAYLVDGDPFFVYSYKNENI